mmetsp:Transcript_12351/g.18106  ORF Transcript_12351/g.18106 Transcript_12351/m.18106 type:complete len:206 (+) Transcript_12351:72-689(+)
MTLYKIVAFALFAVCNAFSTINFKKGNSVLNEHSRIQPSDPSYDDVNPSGGQLLSEEEQTTNIPNFSLLGLLSPAEDCKADQMGASALAYIGDVVYELLVRSKIVWPELRTADLQTKVVSLVRAEYQAELLARLKEDFPLTQNELNVLRRGRNGSGRGNRRNAAAYNDATSFETLLGYVYITSHQQNDDRCAMLLNWVYKNLEEM